MAGISFKKEKENILPSAIKAGITSQPAERDFKGDAARKKIEDRGSLRGRGFRRDGTTPAVKNLLTHVYSQSSSLVVKSDAPDQGALMHRGNEMFEISTAFFETEKI